MMQPPVPGRRAVVHRTGSGYGRGDRSPASDVASRSRSTPVPDAVVQRVNQLEEVETQVIAVPCVQRANAVLQQRGEVRVRDEVAAG
jgi:hypothetical protein